LGIAEFHGGRGLVVDVVSLDALGQLEVGRLVAWLVTNPVYLEKLGLAELPLGIGCLIVHHALAHVARQTSLWVDALLVRSAYVLRLDSVLPLLLLLRLGQSLLALRVAAVAG